MEQFMIFGGKMVNLADNGHLFLAWPPYVRAALSNDAKAY
jgi:hypothetical protein